MTAAVARLTRRRQVAARLIAGVLAGLVGGLAAGADHDLSAGLIAGVAATISALGSATLSALGASHRRRAGEALSEWLFVATSVSWLVAMISGLLLARSDGPFVGMRVVGFGLILGMGVTEAIPFERWALRLPSRGALTIVASRRTTLGLAALAAWLVGPRRTADEETWQADLAGLPAGRATRYALGLLWAAIRMRMHDVATFAWRPVDWLLQTDGRAFALTLMVAVPMVLDFYTDGGISNIFSNWDNLFALGGTTWAITVGLRKVRGITPRPPRPRRQHEGVDR